MSYGVSSRSYFRRAEKLLGDSLQNLYFMLLLNCVVGSKRECSNISKHRNKFLPKKRNGWQIAKLAKNIERIFRTGDKLPNYILRKG